MDTIYCQLRAVAVYINGEKHVILWLMNAHRLDWRATVKALLWLVRGVVVGICIGVVISLFVSSIEIASHIRRENWWLYLFLPVVAAFTVYIYKRIGKSLEMGTT